MTNRLSNILCCLVLASAFAVVGCERAVELEVIAYKPLLEPNFVVPDYVSVVIEATGGRRVWVKTKKLKFDCVVTFYKPDGSFYLTEQHHEICPWLNSIRISAEEPQGKFICQLLEDDFSVLQEGRRVDALQIAVCERYLAEAILDMTTAPARLLDRSVEFTKVPATVKIEGLWYYPIERVVPGKIGIKTYWSKVVFYQNRDTFLVDMLWLAGADGKFFAVRGYDYHEVVRMDSQGEKGGVWVPTKIEIFRTDANAVLQERLVKIDYYRIQDTKL